MKPSTWDRQLGMVSPLKSAAIQSGQTNDPSKNEVGLDVSHHIHLSLEGRGKYFFLDILFHRMSVIGMLRQLTAKGGDFDRDIQRNADSINCNTSLSHTEIPALVVAKAQ